MNLKERYEGILTWFSVNVPVAETELTWTDPFRLIVAVILSAQCTDKRVNIITPALFSRFPDADSMALASVEEIFDLIKSCSYPNNKAKHIKGMAEMIVSRFSGRVPWNCRSNSGSRKPNLARSTACSSWLMPSCTPAEAGWRINWGRAWDMP